MAPMEVALTALEPPLAVQQAEAWPALLGPRPQQVLERPELQEQEQEQLVPEQQARRGPKLAQVEEPGQEAAVAVLRQVLPCQLQVGGDAEAASWWKPPMPALPLPCLLQVRHRRSDRGEGPRGRPCGARDRRALLP